MEDDIDNIKFCLQEIHDVVFRNQSDIPEDVSKTIDDFIFHALNILNEMERDI